MQEKKLGLPSIVATGVGLIIATSCLLSIGQGASAIGLPFIITMAIACAFNILTAFSICELNALMPNLTGGMAQYTLACFGPFVSIVITVGGYLTCQTIMGSSEAAMFGNTLNSVFTGVPIPGAVYSIVLILILLGLTTFYPFWDCLVVSFSSLKSYLATNIHLWPDEWSFEGYAYMLKSFDLWRSYANSIFITVVGTLINMLITTMAAYVLSKKDLKGQRFFMFLAVFTMMFTGGIIPTYIVVKDLHLMNSLWAMILPSAVNTYNLIILRNFFLELPMELEEAALLDGCTEIGVLFRIMLPISKPALTTVTLFYAVDHWNDFFSAIMYINKKEAWPLQLFLRSMLFQNDAAYSSGGESLFLLGQPMKMAAVMLAIIPIMCAYPFFQKYFTAGMTAGAVKG